MTRTYKDSQGKESPDTHDRKDRSEGSGMQMYTEGGEIKGKTNKRVGRIKGTGGRWEIKGESYREDEEKRC